ncbi:hypothetical protein TNCV_803681 [Trichonephila clavipes]|nr:hypothetical protein TNCV_803681 [Trichonephila clavipes]
MQEFEKKLESILAKFQVAIERQTAAIMNSIQNIMDTMFSRLVNVLETRSIIRSINTGRSKFSGHIYHMDPSSLTFRIFNYKPIRTKTKGRPKLRWADCEENDFKILRVTNWRSEWRRVLEKALAHPGLRADPRVSAALVQKPNVLPPENFSYFD